MNAKKCKCGTNISFIRTKSGKAMPVEADHKITVIMDDGEVKQGYVPHWIACPYSKQFRDNK